MLLTLSILRPINAQEQFEQLLEQIPQLLDQVNQDPLTSYCPDQLCQQEETVDTAENIQFFIGNDLLADITDELDATKFMTEQEIAAVVGDLSLILCSITPNFDHQQFMKNILGDIKKHGFKKGFLEVVLNLIDKSTMSGDLNTTALLIQLLKQVNSDLGVLLTKQLGLPNEFPYPNISSWYLYNFLIPEVISDMPQWQHFKNSATKENLFEFYQEVLSIGKTPEGEFSAELANLSQRRIRYQKELFKGRETENGHFLLDSYLYSYLQETDGQVEVPDLAAHLKQGIHEDLMEIMDAEHIETELDKIIARHPIISIGPSFKTKSINRGILSGMNINQCAKDCNIVIMRDLAFSKPYRGYLMGHGAIIAQGNGANNFSRNFYQLKQEDLDCDDCSKKRLNRAILPTRKESVGRIKEYIAETTAQMETELDFVHDEIIFQEQLLEEAQTNLRLLKDLIIKYTNRPITDTQRKKLKELVTEIIQLEREIKVGKEKIADAKAQEQDGRDKITGMRELALTLEKIVNTGDGFTTDQVKSAGHVPTFTFDNITQSIKELTTTIDGMIPKLNLEIDSSYIEVEKVGEEAYQVELRFYELEEELSIREVAAGIPYQEQRVVFESHVFNTPYVDYYSMGFPIITCTNGKIGPLISLEQMQKINDGLRTILNEMNRISDRSSNIELETLYDNYIKLIGKAPNYNQNAWCTHVDTEKYPDEVAAREVLDGLRNNIKRMYNKKKNYIREEIYHKLSLRKQSYNELERIAQNPNSSASDIEKAYEKFVDTSFSYRIYRGTAEIDKLVAEEQHLREMARELYTRRIRETQLNYQKKVAEVIRLRNVIVLAHRKWGQKDGMAGYQEFIQAYGAFQLAMDELDRLEAPRELQDLQNRVRDAKNVVADIRKQIPENLQEIKASEGVSLEYLSLSNWQERFAQKRTLDFVRELGKYFQEISQNDVPPAKKYEPDAWHSIIPTALSLNHGGKASHKTHLLGECVDLGGVRFNYNNRESGLYDQERVKQIIIRALEMGAREIRFGDRELIREISRSYPQVRYDAEHRNHLHIAL